MFFQTFSKGDLSTLDQLYMNSPNDAKYLHLLVSSRDYTPYPSIHSIPYVPDSSLLSLPYVSPTTSFSSSSLPDIIPSLPYVSHQNQLTRLQTLPRSQLQPRVSPPKKLSPLSIFMPNLNPNDVIDIDLLKQATNLEVPIGIVSAAKKSKKNSKPKNKAKTKSKSKNKAKNKTKKNSTRENKDKKEDKKEEEKNIALISTLKVRSTVRSRQATEAAEQMRALLEDVDNINEAEKRQFKNLETGLKTAKFNIIDYTLKKKTTGKRKRK